MQVNSIFLQIHSYIIWFSSIFQELLWDSFKGSYISCLVKVKASFYKKSRAMVWEAIRKLTKEEMDIKETFPGLPSQKRENFMLSMGPAFEARHGKSLLKHGLIKWMLLKKWWRIWFVKNCWSKTNMFIVLLVLVFYGELIVFSVKTSMKWIF